jgi:purine-nucleoside phosphorylase
MHGQQLTLAHMSQTISTSEALARAVATVRRVPGPQPTVGIVLGSGLGAFADTLLKPTMIGYADIPEMARSSVAGHAGKLVLGRHGALNVAALCGRVHLYEGHAPERVVFGVRLLVALGVRTVILTNAAGSIRPDLAAGDLMLIEDHLNLTGQNALAGANDAALGQRFPQMNDAYDPDLRALCQRVASERGIALQRGVYAGLLGPSYETPAEVRMLRTLGADAVGMSTVLETIAARHMGARCVAISCITNQAAGLVAIPPDHAEVQRVAAEAGARFTALLSGVLDALAAEARPA